MDVARQTLRVLRSARFQPASSRGSIMRVAMTEDKCFAWSKLLRKQPEHAQPERGAEQEGDQNAAGGTQPVVGIAVVTGLDDSNRRHDVAVAASVGEVRNNQVREWPIYESPSGHAAEYSKVRASRF